ncbi:MAG: DUF433 domain-containing protein [Blastocatellia bacterium]|nr:DUF433 domain-containing protein [Blastocatellia bacterium]
MNNDIGAFIICTPELKRGRPRIAGTGLTVHRIAIWYNLGHTPEEIAHQYQHLSLAQVYAALSYYHANRDEIDAEIEADQVEADKIEEEYKNARKTA